jgi:hypothetical protein
MAPPRIGSHFQRQSKANKSTPEFWTPWFGCGIESDGTLLGSMVPSKAKEQIFQNVQGGSRNHYFTRMMVAIQ